MTKEELRQKRINLGLTQTELAKKLDVKNNTVARWESGVLSKIPKMVELAMQAVEINFDKASTPVQNSPVIAPQMPVQSATIAPNVEKVKSPVTASDTTIQGKQDTSDNEAAKMIDGEKYITTAEVGERLGLSKKSITDYINKGNLMSYQSGARKPHLISESNYAVFEIYYRNLTGK